MLDAHKTHSFNISDPAAYRITQLIEEDEDASEGLMMRVTVSGGGCSGFQYSFSLDNEQLSDDHIFEHKGVKVIIDEASLNLLDGSTLDYVEDLASASFVIKNPNAASSCGCGNSFSI